MPEATFLHIQGRDDATTRVIELPIGPIRIGRGSLCEVRLTDPDLGEVQCMLRRRGSSWHFQPVGRPGLTWIDGRLVDQQRSLPLDMPFQVGSHWLTLRRVERPSPSWSTVEPPVVVEPSSPRPATEIDPAVLETLETPDAGPSNLSPGSDARLQRWQSRVDQRGQWQKDRQDEKRWEARWKAAGETIRNRSARPETSTPPTPRPTPAPSPPPPPATRSLFAPPAARPLETRPAPTFRRLAEPTNRPSPPPPSRVPVRPIPAPAPTSKPSPPPSPPVPRTVPTVPIRRALTALPAPSIDWADSRSSTIEPGPASESSPELPPEPVARLAPVETPEPVPPTVMDEPSAELASISEPEPEPEIATIELEVFDAVEPIEEPFAEVAESPRVEPVVEVEPSTSVLPALAEPWPDSSFDPGPIPFEAPAPRSEWPSARSIFEAQTRRRHEPRVSPSSAGRKASVNPSPTDLTAPQSWSIPLWLGWIPTASLLVVLGLAGLSLAYEWTLDGMASNQALKLAGRDEKSIPPTIATSSLPRGGWWTSTAAHQAAWAVALARSVDGLDRSEDIASMVEAARHASPLSSNTRFVLESIPRVDSPSPADLAHLGRSRDIVTMTWTGRKLRQLGKDDASLQAYRQALDLAARADRDGLETPSFNDDDQVRRYRLPREAIFGSVVQDMVRAGQWTHEQWVEALPATAAAPWFASRILEKARNRPEADRLADLCIERAEAQLPDGFDRAEHQAAVAESLAFRRRWADSVTHYRLAIEQADDDSTRRRWSFNLAEAAHGMGDDATRSRAIESAKLIHSSDEITMRASRYQQSNPGLAARGDRP